MSRRAPRPKPKKVKKEKRVKLQSLARIRRRLARLWAVKVRLLWGDQCAVHGEKEKGDKFKLDTHHLENRSTCAALRYNAINGILLCSSSHKWGRNSAHRGCIWFAAWLRKHHRPLWRYVLRHRKDFINLNDRQVLAELEAKLIRDPTDFERRMVLRDAE